MPPIDFDEVRIENTNQCGYKCFFCPRDEMSRSIGYMTVQDLDVVLNKVGNHEGRVDLHGFGEPLLDRTLPEKIRLVKARWPKASVRIISTLGLSLKRSYFEDLVSSGLDTLEISIYGVNEASYAEAHGVDKFSLVKDNIIILAQLAQQLSSQMELVIREFPAHEEVTHKGLIHSDHISFSRWLLDVGIDRISRHDMHNYGGGRNYNAPAINGVCSVAWGYRKRVLQVTWDLDVIPCCFDSDATVRFGNLKEGTLSEIFKGERYIRFIADHRQNTIESYPVCMNCERCFKA